MGNFISTENCENTENAENTENTENIEYVDVPRETRSSRKRKRVSVSPPPLANTSTRVLRGASGSVEANMSTRVLRGARGSVGVYVDHSSRKEVPRRQKKRSPRPAKRPRINAKSKATKVKSHDEKVHPDPEDADECIICYEGFQDIGDKSYLLCAHCFHKGCIDKWLAIGNSCPVCRGLVKNDNE